MNKLIDKNSPSKLIDVYAKNEAFFAVVNAHEKAGSGYTEMLEDAVFVLAENVAQKNELLLKYTSRFGPLV